MANSPNRFNNIDPRQAVSQAFGVNGDLNSTSPFFKGESISTAFEIKYSRLPITRTLANLNLTLTRTLP